MELMVFGRTSKATGWAGDCFEVTACDGDRFLIDLGTNNAARTSLVHRPPRIFILSHDDADHIGGAARLLRDVTSSGEGRELWVPYEWHAAHTLLDGIESGATVLPAASADLREVSISMIVDALGDRPERRLPDPVEDQGAEPLTEERLLGVVPNPDEVLNPDSSDDESDNDENFDESVENDDDAARSLSFLYALKHGGDAFLNEAVDRAIKSARSTRPIIQTASRRGWRIRYFLYEEEAPDTGRFPLWRFEGLPGQVTLVNAREMRVSSRTHELEPTTAALFALAAFRLTVQNDRSLVTYVWPDHAMRDCCGRDWCRGWAAWHHRSSGRQMLIGDGQGGLVFWADSSGRFTSRCEVPMNTVSTAPHHGSPSPDHSDAWVVIEQKCSALVISTRNRRITTASPSLGTRIPCLSTRSWPGTATDPSHDLRLSWSCCW